MSSLRRVLFVVLTVSTILAKGQVSYFKKVKEYTITSATAAQLIFKLDSLKQTRRPNDSGIKLIYSRDVDFGFRHQKITVSLNSDHYTVDLLTKNDTLIAKAIQFGYYTLQDDAFINLNKKYKYFEPDTAAVLKFLSLKNRFYGSHKTITDLKEELCDITVYAHYCGEATQKTVEFTALENLVKRKDLAGLNNLLGSLSCEQQAFGVDGIKMLKKSGYKVPKDIDAIASHIKKRNSELTTCSGCLLGVIAKANK